MSETIETVSDETLARQTQAGSHEAYEQLVHRFERRIFTFVSRTCGPAADAAEITQATFVKAFQAIRHFDPRYTFAAWLFTIARRKCIDQYRAAPPPGNGAAIEPIDSADPAELLARKEERHNLWDLIRPLLSPGQFQALWLRYAEDLDVPEIARVLRKTRIHTKVILFRARQKLAVAFKQRPFLSGATGADIPAATIECPVNSANTDPLAARNSRLPARAKSRAVRLVGLGAPVKSIALFPSKPSL